MKANAVRIGEEGDLSLPVDISTMIVDRIEHERKLCFPLLLSKFIPIKNLSI